MNLRHELNKLFIKNITERPNDWEVDDYRLIDTLTKRKWWICNGPASFGQTEPISCMNYKLYWWLNKTHRKAWRLAKNKVKQLRYEYECMQWMSMEREANEQIAKHHQEILDKANDEALDEMYKTSIDLAILQSVEKDQENVTHLSYRLEKNDKNKKR